MLYGSGQQMEPSDVCVHKSVYRSSFGARSAGHRRSILHPFNGLVRSGGPAVKEPDTYISMLSLPRVISALPLSLANGAVPL